MRRTDSLGLLCRSPSQRQLAGFAVPQKVNLHGDSLCGQKAVYAANIGCSSCHESAPARASRVPHVMLCHCTCDP